MLHRLFSLFEYRALRKNRALAKRLLSEKTSAWMEYSQTSLEEPKSTEATMDGAT